MFYQRFEQIGYQPGVIGWNPSIVLDEGAGDNSLLYPWKDDQAPENLSIALIGQAKHTFAWDVSQWVLTDSEINNDNTFGDGIPDYWENYWFGDFSYAPDEDYDLDGINNGLEFSLGYDPTSSANSTEITAIEENISLKLEWGGQETIALLINNPTTSIVNYTASLSGGQAGGYVWDDSVVGSVAYNWTEISATGTALTAIESDDNDSAEITLQHVVFPFYGDDKTSLWVSTNGYLNFRQEYNDSSNDNLPDYASPYGAIAAFWDDLDTGVGGDIYYQEYPASNPDRLIVQYEGVAKDDSSGVNTFQIVLHHDGIIEFFYKQMNGDLDESSVGIQNIFRNQGIQLAYNEAYLQNNMAIRFTPSKQMVSLVNPSGIVPASSSLELNLNLDKENVFAGSYAGVVSVVHDGQGTSPIEIPFQLEIPYAKVTAPTSGLTLFEGESLSSSSNYFRAKVIDAPESIDEVEFLYTTGSIGRDTSPSNDEYTRSWFSLPAGEHKVFARVKLSNGETNDSAPITVVAIPDSDGDKMDDRWEQFYFSGTQEDPLGDYDQDGASNLHEYEFGFDPDDDTQTPQNISSDVTITEPDNNYTVLEGDTINFKATATDEDFGFERIEFWSNLQPGSPLISGNSSGSVSLYGSGNIVGTHVVTAVTVDRYGKMSDLSPSITVVVLPDSDGDRMDDNWEIASFGDLLQEASADFDGDRFPNIFEYHHGTDAGTESGAAQSYPPSLSSALSPLSEVGSVVSYYVDLNYFDNLPPEASPHENAKTTITAALSSANDFDILEVLPGIYNETIDINDRVFLYGCDYARETVIDASGLSGILVDLNTESVLDGFTIKNGGTTSFVSQGAGVNISVSGDANKPRLIGCLVVDNLASSRGGGIYLHTGDLTLVSCSVIGNTAPKGAGFYHNSSSSNISLINTLFWNEAGLSSSLVRGQEIEGGTGNVLLLNTLHRDDLTGSVLIDGVDQGTDNPGITAYYGIYHSSPAKDAGNALIAYSRRDSDNESRDDGLIDIGVDEVVDGDGDAIADTWMAYYGLSDASGHDDSDAFTNLEEYQNQTDPLQADTDGDSVSDSGEVNLAGTNPLVADSDDLDTDLNQDGIDDSVGLILGISLSGDDQDGDNLTNAQEIELGTDPTKADTDGDGTNDDLDDFPLDPTRDSIGNSDPSDTSAPSIFLRKPPGAVLL
ncbi:MAG: Ig-like domain-containing protein [Coraliomargarita sp.]